MMNDSLMPLLVVLAVLGVLSSIIMLTLRGCDTRSKRTVLGTSCAILAICCTGAIFLLGDRDVGALHSDTGLILCAAGMSGLLTVSGLIDRARPAGLALCAILSTSAIFYLLRTLLPLFALSAHPAAGLFAVIITAGMAHLWLLGRTEPHPTRFLANGSYRVTLGQRGGADVLIALLLTLSLTILGWRFKAFTGVDSVFQIYGTLIACLVAGLTAGMLARWRNQPEQLFTAALALPAAALLIIALLPTSPKEVTLFAIGAGISTAMARDILIAMRADDPSATLCALVAPAIYAWLAYAVSEPAQLADSITILIFWMATGTLLGVALRLIAMATVGLSHSNRLIEEGMDTRLFPAQ